MTYACSGLSLAGADVDVGTSYWLVHRNTGSGFVSPATTWCLPNGYAKGYFNDDAGDSYCDQTNGYARPTYRTTEIVNGGREEMVVTYACSGLSLKGADASVGATRWLLH